MREPTPVPGKPKTYALWSIESNAYLCDTHAMSGLDVTMLIQANDSRSVSVRALSGERTGEARKAAIRSTPRPRANKRRSPK